MSRRALKNTIMITVLIVTLGLTGLTVYKASSGTGPGNKEYSRMHGMEQKGEISTDENGQMQKREIPTDENGQEEMREMPTNENGKAEKPRDMRFENGREMKKGGAHLSITYYILFGIEGVIIGFIVIYLIATKMNQQGVKETLKNKKKIAIIIVGTIILAVGVTVGLSAVSDQVVKRNAPQENFDRGNGNIPMDNNSDSNNQQSTNGSV